MALSSKLNITVKKSNRSTGFKFLGDSSREEINCIVAEESFRA